MQRSMSSIYLLVGTGALYLYTAFGHGVPHAVAADWPQWRGPNRDAASQETGILTTWPKSGPKELWRIPIGDGFSAISVVGDRVYTVYGNKEGEVAVCLRVSDGSEIWRFAYPGRLDNRDFLRSRGGNGPRATPTIANGRLYGLGAKGLLYCLDAEKGEKIWMRDLVKEDGAAVGLFGFAASPLVEGDKVFVNVKGATGQIFLAFNEADGKPVWRQTEPFSTEDGVVASPIAISLGGQRQLVFLSETGLTAVRPNTGEVLWRHPWKAMFIVATPNFVEGHLFISTNYGPGCGVLKLDSQSGSTSVREVWRSTVLGSHHANTVVHQGYVYGYDGKTPALLTCVELKTGKKAWRTREVTKGDLILVEGHLIIITHDGELVSVEATPEGYREKARSKVLDGQCWTAPSIANGRLYLRNNDNEMVCLDLSAN